MFILIPVAERVGTDITNVKNIIIWGNHSSTQFPDAQNGTANGKPINEFFFDESYLESEFLETIQKRGAAVIAARKMSSAMSAAKAAADHVRDWWFGTTGTYVSMGVMSDGSYNIPKDIVFSFPVEIQNKQWKIVRSKKYFFIMMWT